MVLRFLYLYFLLLCLPPIDDDDFCNDGDFSDDGEFSEASPISAPSYGGGDGDEDGGGFILDVV